MRKLRMALKRIEFIENICFFSAACLVSWVDWRLGVALVLYELNVAFMILRHTYWRPQ